jgi:hypothetical protein
VKLALFLVALVAGAWVLDRLMLKAEDRGWIYWRRRRASPGTTASAALEVHQILEPSKKYVLEVHRDEMPTSDQEGEPPAAGGATDRDEPGGRRP